MAFLNITHQKKTVGTLIINSIACTIFSFYPKIGCATLNQGSAIQKDNVINTKQTAKPLKPTKKKNHKKYPKNSLKNFILGGSPIINLRYRYARIDQDGIPYVANASTLRTRLGYKTGSLYGFTALLTFQNVVSLGPEHYNSTVNGKTQYPVVADPTGTQIDQAYLFYVGIPKTKVTIGRQAITLGNARFIGNVGWRQIQQTFNAVDFVNKTIADTKIKIGYIWGVNRVFGERASNGRFASNSYFFNAIYKGLKIGTLSGYTYLLDLRNSPANSSNTFGGRLTGQYIFKRPDGLKFLYTAEYARQESAANNPGNYALNYFYLVPGILYAGVTLKAGWEVLDGNGINAFQTPLATLHKFNGWADRFLTTPVNGLEDRYFSLSYKMKSVSYIEGTTFNVVYHNFKAEKINSTYGNEWDLAMTKTFLKHYTVGLYFANYHADTFATNTNMFWAQISAIF